MFSLGLGSWHSPDSRVRPTIIFLFETVKSREILFCVARGRGGVEEGGQLPGGRGLDGRPGQNARQQGGFLVSLDEQPRWHCKHLPRVQTGSLRELSDGEGSEGQHGVYRGQREIEV